MGSFMGHIVPGSFFLLFGVWWIMHISRLRARNKRSARPASSLSMRTTAPFACCPSKPVEPIVMISCCAIGIMIESYGSFKQFSAYVYAPDVQHISMYALFAWFGVCDILVQYSTAVPEGLDYAAGILAFTGEALLFYFHLTHQPPFEQTAHFLLVMTIVGCGLSALLESFYPAVLDLKYPRAFFVTLQGTWFYQLAFIIYSPFPGAEQPWHSAKPHQDIMWLTIFYIWHAIGVMLLIVVISVLFHWRHGGPHTRGTDVLPLVFDKKISRNGAAVKRLSNGIKLEHEQLVSSEDLISE